MTSLSDELNKLDFSSPVPETAESAAPTASGADAASDTPAASATPAASDTSVASDSPAVSDMSVASDSPAAAKPEILPPQKEFGKKRPDSDYEEHVAGHLKELRNRIIIAGAALLVGALLAYPFSGEAIAYLWARFIPESVIMSIYSPTEYLMTRLKLSVAIAVCIFFPLLMYELFKFMSRGLYRNERKFLIKVVPLSFILFLMGAALAYFIILPLFLNYVLFYSDQSAVAQIGLGETFNTIISLVLGFGLVFQVPLLMVSVVRMGIVEEKTLRKARWVVYGALVGFAFLIAPDPTMVSQLLAGAALIILFEFSLILLKFV
ncbi:Sec-independent protein translocase protein TatC [Methanimicrococcus sp. At1]|uniref:Sec-independent protein translocase protein TatC n=1 Tax=Methanimicrococcus hacksteinii TaxID=3028293 RepID=A0ABU3VMU0_9EURY|nr:twin-arginine translocase subunit TatC [Methanimicrococcus sp. At1]MDV0444707.1 Sec-independent protein translocase protein TatC [Methanimicrococcus sp. At1]